MNVRLQVRFAARAILASLWLCVGLFPIGKAFAADSLTIDALVAQVVQTNKQVESARLMQLSAEESARATGRWSDPMLMLGIENTPKSFDLDMDPMTMRVIGLSQEIPYSGSRSLQQKAAKSAVSESAQDRRTVERNLAYAARLVYIDLYSKRQVLSLLEQQQALLQQSADATLARLEANQATQDQVLSARSDIWRLEASIISLTQEIDALRFRFNSLRGALPDDSIPYLTEPTQLAGAVSLANWLLSARENYPPLAKLNSSAERYRFEERAANRMRWPMLNLSAEYGIRTGREVDLHGDPGEEREDMISLGLSISLPIFSRGSQAAMARSMKAMAASQTAEADQMWRDTESTLRSLHQRLARIDESIVLYRDKIIPNAEDANKVALSSYEANRLNLSDLLQTQIALISDRTTLITLEAERSRTEAEALLYIESNSLPTQTDTGK